MNSPFSAEFLAADAAMWLSELSLRIDMEICEKKGVDRRSEEHRQIKGRVVKKLIERIVKEIDLENSNP